MKTRHTHRAIPRLSQDYGFTGSVRPDNPNPAAHGNITQWDTCRCGATRATNINGRHIERGPWEMPTAAPAWSWEMAVAVSRR